MPEGDSIERIARGLAPLVGTTPRLTAPDPRAAALRIVERTAGRPVTAVEARGKHLLVRFADGPVLHVHLRMTGRVEIRPAGARPRRPDGAALVTLAGGGIEAAIHGAPVLELLTDAQLALHPVLRRLGGDVLDDGFDPERAAARLRALGGDRPIASALLDQRALAGIGNVWKSELLHLAGIAPGRAVATLAEADLVLLATLAHERMRGPRPGAVYRRAGRPCPRCGTPIATALHGDEGRRSWWCPACQR